MRCTMSSPPARDRGARAVPSRRRPAPPSAADARSATAARGPASRLSETHRSFDGGAASAACLASASRRWRSRTRSSRDDSALVTRPRSVRLSRTSHTLAVASMTTAAARASRSRQRHVSRTRVAGPRPTSDDVPRPGFSSRDCSASANRIASRPFGVARYLERKCSRASPRSSPRANASTRSNSTP